MDSSVCSPDKMNFYNIFPYSPGEEELLAQEAIEYVERTGNEIILYCMTLHPQGFPAMKKAEQYLASYRKFKAALTGSKVRLGVLFQAVLGHWPRVDKDEEQWTRTVDSNGREVRFCPLDGNFRKYIYDVTVMFAKEAPVLILGDDDIRAFSPYAECFCPIHTAEFSKRMGRNYTQEEYIKAVNDSAAGDKAAEVFNRLQREMVDGVAALIRKAIDSVDPSIPAGSCMPCWESLFNGSTAASFAAAGQPPLMRVCNSDYNEDGVNIFPEVVVRTQALYQLHKNIPVLLDESDTCPHNLYSRSATSMTAKLVTSIMSGLNGAKLWFVNAHKNGVAIHRRYTDFLAARKKFFPELLRTVRQSSISGVSIPASSRCPAWHPVHNWQFMVPLKSWAGTMFGTLGIPFNVTYDLAGKQVYALAGSEAVNMFDDDELKTLLSGKLLLDGAAAAELSRRGFDEYTGISAEKKEFRFNGEKNCISGQNYPITKDGDTPFITVKNSGVKVMTELQYSPYPGSPLTEKAAPGTTFFRNALGGHICVTAFHMDEFALSRWNEPRKAWLLEILAILADGENICAVLNEQKYLMLTREADDGSTLAVVVNTGFDYDAVIRIKYAGNVEKVENLANSGQWEPLNFTAADGTITVAKSMMCYEYAVLRIS